MILYKQSYYNFVVSSGEYICLYNTKTGCVGVLKEDKTKIMSILSNPNRYTEESIFRDLLESQFIIEDDRDEIYEVAYNLEMATKDAGSLNLIILPTEACNFSCPYCFVKENNVHMSNKTYDSIIHYIDKQYNNYHLHNTEPFKVSIGWFGGEPTLYAEDIIIFMRKLKKKDIQLDGKIVTNGYLLTDDLFRRLLNAGVNNFQVTLDGVADNHDKFRKLKSGEGTFEKIYDNLLKIKSSFAGDNYQISIRGNFNKNNVSSMRELAGKFLNDFGDDSRFDLSFRPVLDFEQKKDKNSSGIAFCSKQEALKIQSSLANFVYGVNDLKTSNRMFDVLPEPINKWCNVANVKSVIIDSQGNIFACDSVISNKNEAIGKMELDGEISYNSREKRWRETIFQTDKYPKCQQCKLLPVCLGGCTRERLNKGVGCCTWTVDYIETMMEEYCKRYQTEGE